MAEVGQVIGCHHVDSWKDQLQSAKDSGKLVVVDFTATWCPPCRIMAPILSEMAKKFTDVLFLKVDVDELQTVASEWNVDAMPTFLFLKGGNMVDKIVGAHKEELEQKIVKHTTATTAAASSTATA
ncbi:thioredoxin H4-like [Malania oleifera]|uniref:thioredoxin H4-like n=1 Tax=Malania oleifera TaxID=397392 RepID=UPI0025AE7DE1|nr:thioredoxin H4-like [Malania oleifera]